MKKLVTILALSATMICAPVLAQTYRPSNNTKPVTNTSRWNDYARNQYFGVRFGFTASTGWMNHFAGADIETSGESGLSVGFMFGQQIGTADIPLFIEFGVNYIQKGFSSKFEYRDAPTSPLQVYDYRHNMNYLQIPLVFKYKIGDLIVDDLSVQPFAGGFFGIGLASNTLIYESPTPNMSKTKQSTFGDDIFNRMDAGIRIGCGLAWQNLYIEMAYDFGLANLCGDSMSRYYPTYKDFDESAHSGCFSLSIGVDF